LSKIRGVAAHSTFATFQLATVKPN